MRVGFWGVRGSIPAPRRDTWRYGGNTPCLEVRAGDQLFILDAGSGLQELGHALLESSAHKLEVHLLLTHYHWDHVQGLTFFAPLYAPGTRLNIFGARPDGLPLDELLGQLFRPPFFPVSAGQLPARHSVTELDPKTQFTLGTTRIRACPLRHPQGALAFRLEHGGAVVVYATDHEPGDPAADRALCELARGADLLISDAHYLPEELPKKTGWGHGSWETAVALARDAGAKNLFLFHHDPMRTDHEIDQIVLQARAVFPNTWAASESMLVELTRKQFHVGLREAALAARTPAAARANGRTNGGDLAEAHAAPNVRGNGSEMQEEVSWGALGGARDEPSPEAVSVAPRGLGGNGRSRGLEPESAAAVRPAAAAAPGLVPAVSVAEPEAPRVNSGNGGSPQRRDLRISLDGTGAHGVVRNGAGATILRLVDLSHSGAAFLTDKPNGLPETFFVRLHAPVLPAAEVKMQRVYSRPLPGGLVRLGCRFAP